MHKAHTHTALSFGVTCLRDAYNFYVRQLINSPTRQAISDGFDQRVLRNRLVTSVWPPPSSGPHILGKSPEERRKKETLIILSHSLSFS